MILMKCILCGRKNAKINYLCEDCFLKRKAFDEINSIEVKICSNCKRYKEKNHWKEYTDIQTLIKTIISKKLKYRIVSMKLKKKGKKYIANIILENKIKLLNKFKQEKVEIEVDIIDKKCNDCIRRMGRYYEAVLQIRRVDNMITKTLKHFEDKIVDVKELRHGIDFYIMTKKDAKKVINLLKHSGFKINVSHKFLGMKKGKKLYRTYYSVR